MGGGTGFCTQGIVQTVRASNVTLIDQSPHQLAKARKKADLQGTTVVQVLSQLIAGCAAAYGRMHSSLTCCSCLQLMLLQRGLALHTVWQALTAAVSCESLSIAAPPAKPLQADICSHMVISQLADHTSAVVPHSPQPS